MKKRIIAAFAAVCLLAGTGAFAQNTGKTPKMKERPTAEQMAQRKTERMTQKLNLSEEQAKQVQELNLQEIKSMQGHRDQMKAERQANAEKMKSILTPEQYQQWQEAQCSMRQGKCGHKGRMDCKDGKKGCGGKPCPMKDKQGKK